MTAARRYRDHAAACTHGEHRRRQQHVQQPIDRGRRRPASCGPRKGASPRLMANTSWSTRPNQNTGSEMPANENVDRQTPHRPPASERRRNPDGEGHDESQQHRGEHQLDRGRQTFDHAIEHGPTVAVAVPPIARARTLRANGDTGATRAGRVRARGAAVRDPRAGHRDWRDRRPAGRPARGGADRTPLPKSGAAVGSRRPPVGRWCASGRQASRAMAA